jgi:hypothetical protein
MSVVIAPQSCIPSLGKGTQTGKIKTSEYPETPVALVHMHAAEFGAAAKLGKHLSRIEQMVRIEGAFHPHLVIEIRLVEHFRHEITLLDTHAMLAGQHAANLHAQAQDVRAEGFGLLQFARHIGVIEDQRVQIAVAGVKDIGDTQAILL